MHLLSGISVPAKLTEDIRESALHYSRTPVTRTLKGNGGSSYRGRLNIQFAMLIQDCECNSATLAREMTVKYVICSLH